jgi:tripartite-type tricarboxylate transporter receptor subunit TctC
LLPQTIVARLNASVAAALRTPEIQRRIADLGFEPASSTAEELAALLRSETIRWARVVKDAGIEPE